MIDEAAIPSRRTLLAGLAAAGAVAAAPPAPAWSADDPFALPPTTERLTPFQVRIPPAARTDLIQRLDRVRWPERETTDGWAQGVPLVKMQALAGYWRNGYDMRRLESRLNAWPQFRTNIDGLGIHFVHVRSKHPKALPVILTHGWPGSVVEFLNIIAPLVDPTAHGGKVEDAFDVVLPSLPGFGFSDKPAESGWNLLRIARAWTVLMQRLGYQKWVAQGGDWGAGVATTLGHLKPPGLAAIHLNWPFVFPDPLPTQGLSNDEQKAIAAAERFLADEYGYFLEQSTRPQTIGYGLTDSPVGQASWIYEKFQAWSDNDGDVESALNRDEMLDDISLYWFTKTAASSARIYWENYPSSFSGGRIDMPVGVSIFPKEIYRAPRSWAEQAYPQLIYWNELPRGGHFAAFEQPALFVDELRACFASLR